MIYLLVLKISTSSVLGFDCEKLEKIFHITLELYTHILPASFSEKKQYKMILWLLSQNIIVKLRHFDVMKFYMTIKKRTVSWDSHFCLLLICSVLSALGYIFRSEWERFSCSEQKVYHFNHGLPYLLISCHRHLSAWICA